MKPRLFKYATDSNLNTRLVCTKCDGVIIDTINNLSAHILECRVEWLKERISEHGENQCREEHDCLKEIENSTNEAFEDVMK